MPDAYLLDAVRTPFGEQHGALSDMHPQDLAARPLIALEERNGLSGDQTVDDVMYGCVSPVGEQGLNIGRIAPLVAGWGGVPGVQINRICGASQQAVHFAAGQIRADFADAVVAGGVEHMTRLPIQSDSPAGNTNLSGLPFSETFLETVREVTTQRQGTERIAERWEIARTDADKIALDSQKRWQKAAEAGKYDEQILEIELDRDDGSVIIDTDEPPYPETTLDKLAKLPLAFRPEGEGVTHPGNASAIADGAAATLLASGEACSAFDGEPLARVVDTCVVGTDPVLMLTGSIPVTQELLKQNDLTVSDIDRFEVNEAFAPVVVAWLEETGADWEQTNVWGGAIAYGHPLGATGASIIGKLAYQLQDCGGQYGLATMSIGFGQGIATLIERV